MNALADILPPSATPVIDVACWIGTYPFRHIRGSGLDPLKQLAVRLNIERFIAGAFENLFQENGLDAWRDARDRLASQELVELWPVIRPSASGELQRLERICRDDKPRGLRLLPNYHGYSLSDSPVLEVVEQAREHGMVVQIFQRIIDERQQWLHYTPCVGMDDIQRFVAQNRQATILLSGVNGPDLPGGMLTQNPNLLLDVSRMRGPVFAFERLLQTIDPRRLVFGSLWPIQLIEATLWQILEADVPEEHRRAVLAENVQRVLTDTGQTPR